jgi:hypothetical protein
MPRKKQRSPQEKKELSYNLDRRNAYGENDKSSRKSIATRKTMENRNSRRKTNQALTIVDRLPEEQANVLESSMVNDIERVGGWTKVPDQPLRDHVDLQSLRAEQRKNTNGKNKA